jgi:hypothetical protein
MTERYGYQITSAPEKLVGASVFARILDGLAFRYYWATEGLRDEDFDFRPGPESMSMHELLKHVLHLAHMVKQCVFDAAHRDPIETDDPRQLREQTLECLRLVRQQLDRLSDETLANYGVLKSDGSKFPVWFILNGPLSDALTHVGQINAWRRLNGNPQARVNVFAGIPPKAG